MVFTSYQLFTKSLLMSLDRKYLQNIWKQDQELWRKLNKFYIDFSSGESEYFDTC